MQVLKIGLLVAWSMLILACANPSIVNVKESEATAITVSSKIFIPRFEGNPNFVEEELNNFEFDFTCA